MSPDEIWRRKVDEQFAHLAQENAALKLQVATLRSDLDTVERRAISEAAKVVDGLLAGVEAHVARVVESALNHHLGGKLDELLAIAKEQERWQKAARWVEVRQEAEHVADEREEHDTARFEQRIKMHSAVDAKELGKTGGRTAVIVGLIGLVSAIGVALIYALLSSHH